MSNWDSRWMAKVESLSQDSKDPRRKVGCIVVDSDNIQLSGGYNGFPRGIADDDRLQDRTIKNKIIIHAEANAVAAAARKGHALLGGTAYIGHNPCSQCAGLLIQSGIVRVVYTVQVDHSPDWTADFELALSLLTEARVTIHKYPFETETGIDGALDRYFGRR